ncbi:MAG: hypothetical protein HY826_01615 [Actinobacteria bacterium]|nr:hypothetical protein [Actinomycetota bacterium]
MTTRLNKRHVEALLGNYDAQPIVALTAALRVVLDEPDADWQALIGASGLPAERRQRLLAGEQAALDLLARELNELRGLAT